MKPERPKQVIPAEIVEDLLQAIRGQFYGDQSAKKWFQDRGFLLKRVVLWPAGWLNRKAVTLSPERYKAILLEIFQGIKRHGNTAAVAYWPGYLASCVQKHFAVHGEEYFEEGKAIRAKVDSALLMALAAGQAAPAQAPDPVRQLASLQAAIAVRRKPRKVIAKQEELFRL